MQEGDRPRGPSDSAVRRRPPPGPVRSTKSQPLLREAPSPATIRGRAQGSARASPGPRPASPPPSRAWPRSSTAHAMASQPVSGDGARPEVHQDLMVASPAQHSALSICETAWKAPYHQPTSQPGMSDARTGSASHTDTPSTSNVEFRSNRRRSWIEQGRGWREEYGGYRSRQ